MKFRWLVTACLGLVCAGAGFLAAGPALAHHAWRKAPLHCIDRPYHFSIERFLFAPKPRPNGCAPPVFQFGQYIGQDPDPNIRFQLFRDPTTGYTPLN